MATASQFDEEERHSYALILRCVLETDLLVVRTGGELSTGTGFLLTPDGFDNRVDIFVRFFLFLTTKRIINTVKTARAAITTNSISQSIYVPPPLYTKILSPDHLLNNETLVNTAQCRKLST